ncbi:MAG: sulfotransferase family 2 domain-containing protein [Rhodobacteraceae bacterium]|nr:sulfotransferase family 2 domain-containing protein [Paracoccaceae bacterium]
MRHLSSDFKRTARLLRYRVASVYSQRAVFRSRMLKEMPEWHRQGYNYWWIHHRARIVEATGAIYFPVPKAANTALKHMITDEHFSDEHRIHSAVPRGVACLDDRHLTLNDLTTGPTRCFTVVRHPIDRFASAYRNRVTTNQENGLKRSLQTFLNCPEDTSISIDDLIAYVAETQPDVMDQHVCPQWSVCGFGRVPLEMIGKVERLERDVQAFANAGLIEPRSISRLVVRKVLSAKQKSAISRLYARDFEVFNYQ